MVEPSDPQAQNVAESTSNAEGSVTFTVGESTEQSPLMQTSPQPTASSPNRDASSEGRNREESGSPTLKDRLPGASETFEKSSLPLGFMAAISSAVATAPSSGDIRKGSFGREGWSPEIQVNDKRGSFQPEEAVQGVKIQSPSNPHSSRSKLHHDTVPEAALEDQTNYTIIEHHITDHELSTKEVDGVKSSTDTQVTPTIKKADKPRVCTEPYDNGYQFPPQHTWTEATMIAMKAFWKFTTASVLNFLIVIYGLNVVAWGGMIFLLLCNAAPAMCVPTCNDINSPRRKWIEWDSQILTALFSVTGFGLIPWRFRDLYYLLKFRLQNDQEAFRRLGGIHRDWFRMPGSQDLPVTLGPDNILAEQSNYSEGSIPFPLEKIPHAPLTGVRAPPTPVWRLDYVIWMFAWNTFLQAVLSGLMWGLNRYTRPSWSTGVFVALACIVAAMAGIEMFNQGRKVKAIEGIPVSEKDLERLARDKEAGRVNMNTISGKAPKEKKEKKGKKAMESEKPVDSPTDSPEIVR